MSFVYVKQIPREKVATSSLFAFFSGDVGINNGLLPNPQEVGGVSYWLYAPWHLSPWRRFSMFSAVMCQV